MCNTWIVKLRVTTSKMWTDGGRRLQESGFMIDPDNDATDEVMDIHDIETIDVACEDSQ